MATFPRLFAAVGGLALLAVGTTACVGGRDTPAPAEKVVPDEPLAAPSADIWAAAAKGDLQQLESHKLAGTDLDERQSDTGFTPLLITVIVGQQEAAEWLLGNGANANAKMRDGGNALHGAAFVGNADSADLLLRHGVDVNARNAQFYSVWDILDLDWATTEHFSNLLDLDLRQQKVEAGRARIRTLLESEGREGAEAGDILRAVAMGNAARVRALAGGGMDVDGTGPAGNPLILIAAGAGHVEVVATLLAAGANVNAPNPINGATALHAAALFGRAEAAKVLLDQGADATALTNDGATPSQLLDLDWATTEHIAGMAKMPVEKPAVLSGRRKIAELLNAR